MSWSWTLYRYLAVQYLIGVGVVCAIFLTMAFSIDIVDLLNRTAGHNVPAATAIGMAVLYLPNLGQKMLPFAILLGGVFTFVRLSRSRELVATRAAGISAWDFLLPPLTVAVFIGRSGDDLHADLGAHVFGICRPGSTLCQRRGKPAFRFHERALAAPG
jgi:lipopolysaccharide export system permease protein